MGLSNFLSIDSTVLDSASYNNIVKPLIWEFNKLKAYSVEHGGGDSNVSINSFDDIKKIDLEEFLKDIPSDYLFHYVLILIRFDDENFNSYAAILNEPSYQERYSPEKALDALNALKLRLGYELAILQVVKNRIGSDPFTTRVFSKLLEIYNDVKDRTEEDLREDANNYLTTVSLWQHLTDILIREVEEHFGHKLKYNYDDWHRQIHT